MTNLTQRPLFPDPDPKGTAKKIQSIIIQEGRSAFRAGLSKCPPFKDPDMAINWQNGYRWESEGT